MNLNPSLHLLMLFWEMIDPFGIAMGQALKVIVPPYSTPVSLFLVGHPAVSKLPGAFAARDRSLPL